MRKIILIGGDLASGKSTFSVFLAQKYHLTLLNKDRLKEIAGDVIHVNNREENKKLSVLSFEYIKYFIETSTCDLIVESNFKEYEMEELKKYLENNNIMSIRFTGDDDLLHNRFLKRLEGPRHYVHRSQDLSKKEDFLNVLNELRQVHYIGEVVDVFVKDGYDSFNDEVLLNKVDAFLKS